MNSTLRIHQHRTSNERNFEIAYRSHLKIKILVQRQGGLKFQPAGILQYFEDLKRENNAIFGPKDNFETASIRIQDDTDTRQIYPGGSLG